ncbi:uncharacterized protein LOC120110366 [Phoenix dactylifera]|uniref:Uncharacterized protein LOC120110366 n=1 Tax=Phoenix dactylifera TaxID=42345 RepID=A0A8B9A3B8_PHODC|nr:uncharacterized protein LOC120110366 [Phoenix dactylifera]
MMAPLCLVPISQDPGRREAPNSDQGGRTSADLALARPTSTTQRSGQPSTRPQFPSSEPGNSQEATGSAAPRPAEAGLAGPSGPQERVPYAPGWAVFEGDSALDNVQVAREVLRVALLPADQAKIRSMNYGEFMDSAICSSIRRLHETETMIHIIQDYRDRARRHQRGREEAETKFLASEAEQKVLQAKLGAAEDEVRTLVAELEEEKGAHSLTRSEVRAAEARRTEAESSLAIREQEVGEARIKVRDLEIRLLDVQSLLADREREIKILERKAAYHEAREKEAREQAQDAVKLFRESEEFRNLMEEEGVNGLIQGFKDFRNQLRRLLPDFDLSLLQPGAGVENPEAKAEVEVPTSGGTDQEGQAEEGEIVLEVTEAAPKATVGASAAEEPAVPEVAGPEPFV